MATLNPSRRRVAPSAALRGRGAVGNVDHRFQSDSRTPDLQVSAREGDQVDQALPAVRTTVQTETARKLLSYNVSPDIPFDRAVNPYRGCEHGCTYCYARPTHAYLGFSPGLDFETRLIAKTNAVQALRTELSRPGYRPDIITLGSATDGYQPIERQWQLTRGVLQLLDECSHPVVIVTKNALVQRDIDILASMAQRNLVGVFFSITTLDADMARSLEPRASAPWRRLSAMQALSQAGVPVGVLVAPLIPFITDTQLEQVLGAAAQAGACSAGYTVLRLPHEVRQVFTEWLHAHFPDRAQRVLHRIEELNGSRDPSGARSSSRFGARMRGEGVWAQMLAQRFDLARRKSGLQQRGFLLDRSRFSPPALDGQGQLF
nr:PA0069 family radical SAM protein [Pseudomonas sp.]